MIVFEQFSEFSDYHVEGDLHAGLHLADTIYRTHNHLVKHPVNEKMRLGGELDFHNGPYFFSDVLVKGEGLT
jgi:hypothetical protein